MAAAPSGQDFYTSFYTAGRDRLVRSGKDRHAECATSLLKGTRRTIGPCHASTGLTGWSERRNTEVVLSMATQLTRTRMRDLIAAAVRAPSSHNTQPWRFRLDDDAVSVFADRTRRLPVNDPDDRELTISCGAAAFTLEVAAQHAGLTITVGRLPDDQDADLLYRITLTPADTGSGLDDLYRAIEKRCTTRAGFTDEAPPSGLLDAITGAAADHGAWLGVVDQERRGLVADLVAEGDRAQFADPQWRRELASWMHPPSSGDGLATPALIAPIARTVLRHVDLGGRTARSDHDLTLAAPLLVVLGTDGDHAEDWLVAGESLQHVLLLAAGHGVQAGYLNQPCQVTELRRRLGELCEAAGHHPQVVLRLGHPAKPLDAAPRRPVDDVIDADE